MYNHAKKEGCEGFGDIDGVFDGRYSESKPHGTKRMERDQSTAKQDRSILSTAGFAPAFTPGVTIMSMEKKDFIGVLVVIFLGWLCLPG